MIDLLLARRARGGRPPFDDGARIALAVEGGAMRGVVSAGMVSALEELGLTGVFDAAYGSSAGALNAAYFLAGQARAGTTIYYENINNRRFIDVRRAIVGKPIVDLGFLIDDVSIQRKPLDTDRVLASATPLTVMATDVDTAEPAPLRDFRNGADLLTALRAGATMPVIAGPPVVIAGRHLLDASLSEPIPVPMAEDDGFTHVLVLLTRPVDTTARPTLLDRWYVQPRLRRLSPKLADRYANRSGPYSRLVGAIAAGRGPGGTAAVLGLRPAPPAVSRLERDSTVLQEAARRGFNAVMAAFGRQAAGPRQR